MATPDAPEERPTDASAANALKRHFSPIRKVSTVPLENGKWTQGPLRKRNSRLTPAVTRKPTAAAACANDKPLDSFQYLFESDTSDSESSESGVGEDSRRRRSLHKPGNDPTDQRTQPMEQPDKKKSSYSLFRVANDCYKTKGKVSKHDGRLHIEINETADQGYIAKTLGQCIRNHLECSDRSKSPGKKQRQRKDAASYEKADVEMENVVRPRLNIVIIVIGSRGDIQPFLKIGKILKHQYNHRVRIATHPTFRDLVEKDMGLEFFDVGGDPSELMAFMVKQPGLIPSFQTLREGEIQRRRASMREMFEGMWRACVDNVHDEKHQPNLNTMGDKPPFIADAIIANPPSMAHVHIAERLGIPLHIMFTFPYSPTQQFPHPLANIKPRKSNVDAKYVNFMSYPLVEMVTWQGLGDIVNHLRQNTLGLETVSSLWAPGALYRMKVPYTYMWSPSLIPKPNDWGPEIDVSGFVFLEMADNFDPPKDLADFLDAGEPPVYIGFGSIVVDDPVGFTKMIFDAVKIAGVRALVSKGWGGFGGDGKSIPENVFMLENTPHDWLFPRVKAVVHHGGAGTTAIGLKCAKPTMIVPFFGDQPFWGAKVAEAKAGAHECIPWKKLTAEKLAEGIKQCLTEESQRNVQKLADSIAKEGDGAENAVRSFHQSLPLVGRHNMRCSILEDRVAVWRYRDSSLRLSAFAAEVLLQAGKTKTSDLKLIQHYEWIDFDGPGEPITGTVGALTDSLTEIGAGVGMVPTRVAKHVKQQQQQKRKRKQQLARREERRRKKAAAAQVQQQNPQSNLSPAERVTTSSTLNSAISADPAEPLPQEVSEDVVHGLKHSGGALLTLPNDLHLAIAQGFHNAPRLWGDATVRRPIRITDVKTGCQAARDEFAYSIYDGFRGLVTQPAEGWHDGDTALSKLSGLGTGFGKGLGGFVWKNLTAVIAPPAYVGKGVIVSVKKKKDGPGSEECIRRARLIQGQNDLYAFRERPELLHDVQDKVEKGWEVYRDLWRAMDERYTFTGGNHNVGSLKKKKDWKHRYDYGALEDIHTARAALQAAKRGEDLNKFLKTHRKQMELADVDASKRRSVAEDSATNGCEVESSYPDAAAAAATATREEKKKEEEEP